MTLIVDIEEFLEQAKRQLPAASRNDAIVIIHIPQASRQERRVDADPAAAPDQMPDDDELVTWEDAAWQ